MFIFDIVSGCIQEFVIVEIPLFNFEIDAVTMEYNVFISIERNTFLRVFDRFI